MCVDDEVSSARRSTYLTIYLSALVCIALSGHPPPSPLRLSHYNSLLALRTRFSQKQIVMLVSDNIWYTRICANLHTLNTEKCVVVVFFPAQLQRRVNTNDSTTARRAREQINIVWSAGWLRRLPRRGCIAEYTLQTDLDILSDRHLHRSLFDNKPNLI